MREERPEGRKEGTATRGRERVRAVKHKLITSLVVSRSLTLALTWGDATPPPPQVGFVPCTPVFEAEDLIFAIAAF